MFAAPKGKMMLAVLGLTLLLSACSPSAAPATGTTGSSGTANSENSVSSTTTASTAPAETTREFQHTGGTTEVPTEPKRIVTDWFYGELLTLGVRPIAYPEYLLSEYPYVESEGTEGLGESMEQVIGLQPDLIISVWDESYQQFTKIAPDTSVTILSIFQKEVKVHGKRNTGAEVVYKTLGVPAPKAVEELFADTEDWKDLDAVKNGRVHEVDYYDLFYEDPIAVENQIDRITKMLTE